MESKTNESTPWLDREFIQTVIQNNLSNRDVIVKDLDISAVVGKGENYASELCRVTVHLQDGATSLQKHLIVKSLPKADIILKLLLDLGTFERESNMYQVLLPTMNQILSDYDPTVTPLGALCYTTSRPHTIIMDDLSFEGFKMADRRRGLDLAQSSLVARSLARFHASSLVMLKRDPSCLDGYDEKYFAYDNRGWLDSFYDPIISALIAQVSTWPGFEHYADKFREILTVERMIEFMKPLEDELLVLTHGDPWMNNILFRTSSTGEAIDMRFVDFQEMRVVSPTLDLQYFLYSSLSDEVQTAQWPHLLEIYQREFVSILQHFGIEIPRELATVENLEQKMNDKIYFGLMTASTLLPLFLAETNDTPDFENWTDNKEADDNMSEVEGMYSTPRFKTVFKDLLSYFEKNGAFQ